MTVVRPSAVAYKEKWLTMSSVRTDGASDDFHSPSNVISLWKCRTKAMHSKGNNTTSHPNYGRTWKQNVNITGLRRSARPPAAQSSARPPKGATGGRKANERQRPKASRPTDRPTDRLAAAAILIGLNEEENGNGRQGRQRIAYYSNQKSIMNKKQTQRRRPRLDLSA